MGFSLRRTVRTTRQNGQICFRTTRAELKPISNLIPELKHLLLTSHYAPELAPAPKVHPVFTLSFGILIGPPWLELLVTLPPCSFGLS